MKQTVLVKLTPTPELHTALLRTLETFNAACNAIAATAFAEHSASKIDLQNWPTMISGNSSACRRR
jgi:putative transposase